MTPETSHPNSAVKEAKMPHQHLISCGSNGKGQLGNGSFEDTYYFGLCHFSSPDGSIITPKPPPNFNSISKISTGGNHTLLLATEENEDERENILQLQLYGCGDNSRGQLHPSRPKMLDSSAFRPLSLGIVEEEYVPIEIEASWETSYVVYRSPQSRAKSDVLVSFGANDFGDLGTGPLPLQNVPSSKGKEKKLSGDGIHILSFDHLLPPRTESFQIIHLTAGVHHVLAVLQLSPSSQQLLVGWGSCRHGQLGPIPTNLVSAKNAKTPSFIDRPITIQLPISTNSESGRIVGIAAGSQHSVIHLSSGRLVSLGSDRKRQLSGLTDVSSVTQIKCTWNGTYIVSREPGGLRATGSGEKGQLGVGIGQLTGTLQDVQFRTEDAGSLSLEKLVCGSEHVLALLQPRGENQNG